MQFGYDDETKLGDYPNNSWLILCLNLQGTLYVMQNSCKLSAKVKNTRADYSRKLPLIFRHASILLIISISWIDSSYWLLFYW